jgi:RND family efflux transporter MFP subunit
VIAERLLSIFAVLAALVPAARAQPTFTVAPASLADEKAVFGTVESPNVVPARTRIGGTVARLSVRQGDAVAKGQVIAVVADEKLILQISSLDAQIAGLQSTLAQAQTDLARAETLYRQGVGPRTTMDQARTSVEVASAALRARTAERAVAQQNLQEGEVLAPVAGRVLTVPLTAGTVVLTGDPIATIGEGPFLLRLRIPERHAQFLKAGDIIRLAAHQLGAEAGATGTVTLVYPQIDAGRVVADAKVADLGDYFVGDRVLVRINAGTRQGFVVPEDFISTRFGLDFVRIRTPVGVIETPVQRGVAQPNGVEILSGVHAGDLLVRP